MKTKRKCINLDPTSPDSLMADDIMYDSTSSIQQAIQNCLSKSLSNPLLPVHANNAAATGAGMIAGEVYRTGADPDVICIVH